MCRESFRSSGCVPVVKRLSASFQEVRIAAVPFNVRIVLTASPHGIDLADVKNLVEVQNGTVSGLVTGVTFTRIGQIVGEGDSACA